MCYRSALAVVLVLLLGAGCERAEVASPAGPVTADKAREPVIGFDQVPLSQAAETEPAGISDDPLAGELTAERAMQLNLPTADGPIWQVLRQTRISVDETTQMYEAAHSEAVRALAGTRITLQGYMLPLEADDRTAHFLISPYTPVCFFHPPAEPNEVIEVRLTRPIPAGYHRVEITGVLALANNGEKGLFFQMNGAAGRVVERVDGGL